MKKCQLYICHPYNTYMYHIPHPYSTSFSTYIFSCPAIQVLCFTSPIEMKETSLKKFFFHRNDISPEYRESLNYFHCTKQNSTETWWDWQNKLKVKLDSGYPTLGATLAHIGVYLLTNKHRMNILTSFPFARIMHWVVTCQSMSFSTVHVISGLIMGLWYSYCWEELLIMRMIGINETFFFAITHIQAHWALD